ncbi:MAG: GNAT family N-acetyltransferase [Flavobacteriaceae bacterium]
MDDFLIREAIREDLETLLEFEQKLIRAERPFDECIRKDPVQYYDLASMIDDPCVSVVVVENEGEIVSSGYALARKARNYLDHEEYAYLGFMYTLPEFRGKGLNRMVIEKLSSWASNNGLQELRLTVYEENIPAFKAYEKVGFKRHIVEMRMRRS